MIDPIILQAGLDMSYAAGKQVREIMRDSGMTDEEITEVVKEAFAWLHEDRCPLCGRT